MAIFLATQSPFLQSRAKLLILPMSSDGTILQPVLLRTKILYACNYTIYRQKVLDGNLHLGDIIIHKIQKQTTGLTINGNDTPSYIANIITTHHAKHPTQISTFTSLCKKLKPALFHLMQHHGIRHIALFATPMLDNTCNNTDVTLTAKMIWKICQDILDIPRIRLDIHFPSNIQIDF